MRILQPTQNDSFFKMVVFKDDTRTGNRFYYEQKDTTLDNPSNTIFMFQCRAQLPIELGTRMLR